MTSDDDAPTSAPALPPAGDKQAIDASVSPAPPPPGAEAFTPAATCSSRPGFTVRAALHTDGRLVGVVTAQSGNSLRALFFNANRASRNTLIDVSSTVGAAGTFGVALPTGTQIYHFFARPANGAVTDVTAHVVVQDECGFWQSMVGGGRNVAFGAAVPGVVLNACNGRAVRSGLVTVAGHSYPIAGNGAFLAFVPRGTQTLIATSPGFGAGAQTGSFGVGPHPGTSIALNGPSGALSGVVRDGATGQGVTGAVVTVAGTTLSTTTAAGGGFSFASVPTGSRVVNASASDYEGGTTTVTVCADATASASITLQPHGDLVGQVFDATCGNPIVGATVSIPGRTASTDGSGRFAMNDLRVGSYNVTASAPFFQSNTQGVVIQRGATSSLEFRLSGGPNGTITGRVTNASTGAGIAGATVQISGGRSATTDGGGNYTITGVPPATTYDFTVSATGFQNATGSGRLCPGGTLTGNFALTPDAPPPPPPPPPPQTGTVTGVVTDCTNGLPLAGVTVEILGLGITAQTAANGAFTLTNVPIGDRTVSASKGGYVRRDQVISVVAGANPPLSISLCPQSTNNEIRIVLNWGTQPPDLDSHLSGPNGSGGRFHAFYGSKTPVPHASLDVDDTSGQGPETITIKPSGTGAFVPGEYRYWVHNFSGTPQFGQSSARVTVNQRNSELSALAVPGGAAGSNIWHVFNITVDANGNATVTAVNSFQNGTASTVL